MNCDPENEMNLEPVNEMNLEQDLGKLQEIAKGIVEKNKPKINGVMEGDLKPEEYVEQSGQAPGILGYTMSVIRTNPMIRDWYYSEGELYDGNVLIDSLVNGLQGIIDFQSSIEEHRSTYPFFDRAYTKYLETEERTVRDLLRYLYLYS